MESKIKFIFALFFITVLCSCTKSSGSLEVCVEGNQMDIISMGIDNESDEISAEDAVIVALMHEKNAPTKSQSNREVGNVVPVFGADGKVVLYAVNYSGNNGYTLISASKNYFPTIS